MKKNQKDQFKLSKDSLLTKISETKLIELDNKTSNANKKHSSFDDAKKKKILKVASAGVAAAGLAGLAGYVVVAESSKDTSKEKDGSVIQMGQKNSAILSDDFTVQQGDLDNPTYTQVIRDTWSKAPQIKDSDPTSGFVSLADTDLSTIISQGGSILDKINDYITFTRIGGVDGSIASAQVQYPSDSSSRTAILVLGLKGHYAAQGQPYRAYSMTTTFTFATSRSQNEWAAIKSGSSINPNVKYFNAQKVLQEYSQNNSIQSGDTTLTQDVVKNKNSPDDTWDLNSALTNGLIDRGNGTIYDLKAGTSLAYMHAMLNEYVLTVPTAPKNADEAKSLFANTVFTDLTTNTYTNIGDFIMKAPNTEVTLLSNNSDTHFNNSVKIPGTKIYKIRFQTDDGKCWRTIYVAFQPTNHDNSFIRDNVSTPVAKPSDAATNFVGIYDVDLSTRTSLTADEVSKYFQYSNPLDPDIECIGADVKYTKDVISGATDGTSHMILIDIKYRLKSDPLVTYSHSLSMLVSKSIFEWDQTRALASVTFGPSDNWGFWSYGDLKSHSNPFFYGAQFVNNDAWQYLKNYFTIDSKYEIVSITTQLNTGTHDDPNDPNRDTTPTLNPNGYYDPFTRNFTIEIVDKAGLWPQHITMKHLVNDWRSGNITSVALGTQAAFNSIKQDFTIVGSQIVGFNVDSNNKNLNIPPLASDATPDQIKTWFKSLMDEYGMNGDNGFPLMPTYLNQDDFFDKAWDFTNVKVSDIITENGHVSLNLSGLKILGVEFGTQIHLEITSQVYRSFLSTLASYAPTTSQAFINSQNLRVTASPVVVDVTDPSEVSKFLDITNIPSGFEVSALSYTIEKSADGKTFIGKLHVSISKGTGADKFTKSFDSSFNFVTDADKQSAIDFMNNLGTWTYSLPVLSSSDTVPHFGNNDITKSGLTQDQVNQMFQGLWQWTSDRVNFDVNNPNGPYGKYRGALRVNVDTSTIKREPGNVLSFSARITLKSDPTVFRDVNFKFNVASWAAEEATDAQITSYNGSNVDFIFSNTDARTYPFLDGQEHTLTDEQVKIFLDITNQSGYSFSNFKIKAGKDANHLLITYSISKDIQPISLGSNVNQYFTETRTLDFSQEISLSHPTSYYVLLNATNGLGDLYKKGESTQKTELSGGLRLGDLQTYIEDLTTHKDDLTKWLTDNTDFVLSNGIDVKYEATSLGIDKSSQNLVITANFSNSNGDKVSQVLTIHFTGSYNQAEIATIDSKMFSLSDNEKVNAIHVSNPFTTNDAIMSGISVDPVVSRHYSITSVTDWTLKTDSTTDAGHTKIVSAKVNLTNKEDPTDTKTIEVEFIYSLSLFDANTAVFNVFQSSYTPDVTSLADIDASNAFTKWKSSNAKENDSAYNSITIPTNGVVEFSADDYKNNNINPVFAKGFKIMMSVTSRGADGKDIPGSTATKTINVIFTLNRNTSAYVQALVDDITITPTDSFKQSNYLTFDNLPVGNNYFTLTHTDKSTTPLGVKISDINFVQPTSGSSNNATIQITFELDDNDPLTTATYVKNITVAMDKTPNQLRIDEFVKSLNIPLSGTIKINDSNTTKNPTPVGPWASQSDPVASLLNYLKTNATIPGNTQKFDLKSMLDAYNQGKASEDQISIDSVTYTYADNDSKNATVTFNVKIGSATQNVSMIFEYAESYNQYVTTTLLGGISISIPTAFTSISDDAKNLTPLTNFTNGPTDFSDAKQFTITDWDQNTVELSIKSYTPPDGDEKVGKLVVTATFKSDRTRVFDINIDVNFSESSNQAITNRFDATSTLSDLTSALPSTLDDAALKALLPPNSQFAGRSDFTFDTISIETTPSSSQGYDIKATIKAKVGVGAANKKEITFTAQVSKTSAYYLELILAKSQDNKDFVLSLMDQLKTNYGTKANIMSDQTVNNPTYGTDFTSTNKGWYDGFVAEGVNLVAMRVKAPANNDSTQASAEFDFKYVDPKDPNNKGPIKTITIQFNYAKSLNQIKADEVQADATIYSESGYYVIGQDGKLYLSLDLTKPISESDIKTKYFSSLDSDAKITWSASDLGKLTEVANPDGTYSYTQTISFHITFGQSTEVVIAKNISLLTTSKEYVEQVLKHYSLDASDTVKNLTTFTLGSLGADLNIITINSKDTNLPITKTFTELFPNVKIGDISISKVPSKDGTQGEITIVINTDQGNIEVKSNFNFTKSPNQVAIEKFLTNQAQEIFKTGGSVSQDQSSNHIYQVYKTGTSNDPINEVSPKESDLGLTLDSSNKITGFNVQTFLAWIHLNTDLTLDFPSSLSGADASATIDTTTIDSINYVSDINNANQTLTVNLKIGSVTKTLSFNLHFAKSAYAKARETGIANFKDTDLFSQAYLNSTTYTQPKIGSKLADGTWDPSKVADSDFLIQTLNSKHYEIVEITSYTPPTGDQTKGQITLKIVDKDPMANHDPQTWTGEINFLKSPNQALADALHDLYPDAAKTLAYTYDSPMSGDTTGVSPITSMPWPSGYEHVTVVSSHIASQNRFEQVIELKIKFGNSTEVSVFVKGSLNHATQLYVQKRVENFVLSLPTSITSNTTSQALGTLTDGQLDLSLLTIPSDPVSADPTKGTTIVNGISGKGIAVGDIKLVSAEITKLPTGDSKEGKVSLVYAYVDSNGQVHEDTKFTVEQSFNYDHSNNEILLNAFKALADAQTNTLGAFGKTSSDAIKVSALNQFSQDQSTAASWVNSNTNVASFNTTFSLPTGATITNVVWNYDATRANQSVTLTYTLGTASVDVTYSLLFTKTPNQDKIDSEDEAKIANALVTYLNSERYSTQTAPTLADLQINSDYELQIGLTSIHDFVPPDADSKGGSVKLDVWLKQDPTATRTITIKFDYNKSINEAKRDRVDKESYYLIDPYKNGVTTDKEITSSHANLQGATVSDIQTIDENSLLPVGTGDIKTHKTDDERERYTATVSFGNFKTTVILIRVNSPFKPLFDAAMKNFVFSPLDSIIAENGQPKSMDGTFDWSKLKMTDNGTDVTSLPNHISLVPNTFTYTSPIDNDHTEGTIGFDLVYKDTVYTYTKDGITLYGTQGFENTPEGQGATLDPANQSGEEKTYTRHVSFTFNFAHSQNYFDIQALIDALPKEFGEKGSTSHDATTITPIGSSPNSKAPIFAPDSIPVQPASTTPDAILKDQIDWLKNNTNFDDASITADGSSISKISYTQTHDSNVVKVTVEINKGTTKVSTTLNLHFAKTFNQNTLDNLTVNELITGFSSTYLAVAKDSDIDSSTQVDKNAPLATDVLIKTGYEIVGIKDYKQPTNHDGTNATVTIIVRDANDKNATRTLVDVPIKFLISINQNKINNIGSNYELDPFWQSNIEQIPSGEKTASDFLLDKLQSNGKKALGDSELLIKNIKQLSTADATKINPLWVNAWQVEVWIGQSSKTINFGQLVNPLQSKYDAIMQGLTIGVNSTITDALSHNQPGSESDLTFTKNNSPFSLPKDASSNNGSLSFKIDKVTLPTSADDKTATVDYTSTFILKVNGVDHTYVVSGTFKFDYKYSLNGIDIQKVIAGFGTPDTNDKYQIFGSAYINSKDPNDTLNIKDAPASFANDANGIKALIDYLSPKSNVALNTLLTTNGVSISSITYGSNGNRDNKSKNQTLNITFTKGTTTFSISTIINFDKSYNQATLDDKTENDIFNTNPNKFTQAYIGVTKDVAPTMADFLPLKDTDYEIASIDTASYKAPDTDNLKKTATITVTIRRIDDPSATRNFTVNIEFTTIGIDVGSIDKAIASYSSVGQQITLPNGLYTFGSKDPNINGYAQANVQLTDASGAPINVPRNTKLQYKVIERVSNQADQIVSDWSDNKPIGLLNGQIVIVKLVTTDASKFTVENAKEIELTPVSGLVIGVLLPTNYSIPEPTYSGSEGAGKLTSGTLPNYVTNYGTKLVGNENNHLETTYTIYNPKDPNPVHTDELVSDINDLSVGQEVYANVRANTGYFILNPLAAAIHVGTVKDLSIIPLVKMNDINLNTDIDITNHIKGHSGFADGTLVLSQEGIDRGLTSVAPGDKEKWDWEYQVLNADKTVRTAWSVNPPKNLANGEIVQVRYVPKQGYVLDKSIVNTPKDFTISGLLTRINTPSDIKADAPKYTGFEGSGKIDPASLTSPFWKSANQFPFQDQITVEYRVMSPDGTQKQGWTSYDKIAKLNVGDRIYARFVVKDPDNYILMNQLTDDHAQDLGIVTGLEITPRLTPADLSSEVKGVRDHATILIQDAGGSSTNVAPQPGVDHWHWEYAVKKSGDSTIGKQEMSPPITLDNGDMVYVYVVADTNYVLDKTYPPLIVEVKDLKLEIDVSALKVPIIKFQGFIGEGMISGFKEPDGVTDYLTPQHTHWEYYLEPFGQDPTKTNTEKSDPTNWKPFQIGSLGPQKLNVGDKFYLKLVVDNPKLYVLSGSGIEVNGIRVTGLEINPANIHANFIQETFNGKGQIRVDYRDPSIVYSLANPFVPTEDEKHVDWQIRIDLGKGNWSQWLKLDQVKNLTNGMKVQIQSIPATADYAMTKPIVQDITITGLFDEINTSNLDITDFKNLYSITDLTKTIAKNNLELAQIVSGQGILSPARVISGPTDLTFNLPPHVRVFYKYLPVGDPRSMDDVKPTLTPPATGLSNGDRIQVYFGTDDPNFKVNDLNLINFTISGLSPLPPTDLNPYFDYNNHDPQVGISGSGYGATSPSSEKVDNFKWVYTVVSYKDVPYNNSNIPTFDPATANWSSMPPTNLRNGDIVYYKLVTEIPNGVIKPGTHINPITGKIVQNDYLSDPIIIEGLNNVVNIDSHILDLIQLHFEGDDKAGFIADIQSNSSELQKMISSLPHDVIVTIEVNGNAVDLTTQSLANGDKVVLKITPRSGTTIVTDDPTKLAKSFEVKDLKEVINKKQDTLKLVLVIIASISGVGVLGLVAIKYFRNRKKQI